MIKKLEEKFKALSIWKKMFAVSFFIILICTMGYVIINMDTIYVRYENITYSDGCIEHYRNGQLIGDACKNVQAGYGRSIPGSLFNFTWNDTA